MKERLRVPANGDIETEPQVTAPVLPVPVFPMDSPVLQGGNRAAAKYLGEGSGAPAGVLTPAGPTQAGPTTAGPTTAGPTTAGPTTAGPTPVTGVAAPPPQAADPDVNWVDALPTEVLQFVEHFEYLKDMNTEETFVKAGPYDADAAKHARYLKTVDKRKNQRDTFRRIMTTLFGSDDAARLHFAQVKPHNMGSSLVVHSLTWDRLQAAEKLLKDQGLPMPSSGVGLRGPEPEGTYATMFTHATGYAVDFRAQSAPHIKDERLIGLLQTVRGGAEHVPTIDMKMNPYRMTDVMAEMGQGKADPAESKKLLDRLEAEWTRLVEDSEKFKTDLPAQNLEEMQQVVNRVLAAHAKLGKGTQDDRAKATADYKAVHDEATTHFAKIFAPWIKTLDEKIAKVEKDAQAFGPGIDLDHMVWEGGIKDRTAEIGKLSAQRATLQKTAQQNLDALVAAERDSLTLGAKATANREFIAARGTAAPDDAQWTGELTTMEQGAATAVTAVAPRKDELAKLLGKPVPQVAPVTAPKVTAVDAKTMAALHKQADGLTGADGRAAKAAVTAVDTVTAARQADTDIAAGKSSLAADEKFTDERREELGGAETDKTKRKAKSDAAMAKLRELKWSLIGLQQIKDGLLHDTRNFIFNFGGDGTYKNPGVAQLLGLTPLHGGFLKQDPEADMAAKGAPKAGEPSDNYGFRLEFVKAMVQCGFEPGLTWAGNADPMHFELAEGRNRLEFGKEFNGIGAPKKKP